MTQPFESTADRLVREAMERGEFDDLPGAGRPLEMTDAGDPDWWIKRKLREAGDASALAPAEIQLRRQRAALLADLPHHPTDAEAQAAVAAFNALVKAQRVRPPTPGLPPLPAATITCEEAAAARGRPAGSA